MEYTIISDNSAIVNIINDYFSSIGPNLAKTIPQTNKTFADFLKNNNPNTLGFFWLQVMLMKYKQIVDKINSKKSTGYDDISNDLLKHIINEIVIPLEHIMNLSIVNGIVPDNMKIAKVVPISVLSFGDPLLLTHFSDTLFVQRHFFMRQFLWLAFWLVNIH